VILLWFYSIRADWQTSTVKSLINFGIIFLEKNKKKPLGLLA